MMSSQNIVVTVRLSDVDEKDQPDPICLPAKELATWRHFEILLLSMYVNPPSAIRVCYLDDDSDWIELSSDAELKEAIKVAQDTDEILQLQVKRNDLSQHTFESTLSDVSSSTDAPHVTPLQTKYYRDGQEPLVYPHPRTPASTNNSQTQTLVYPHHPSPNIDSTEPHRRNMSTDNVLFLQANGNSAHIQNRPDLSTEEKVCRLKARLSSPNRERDGSLKGLNACLSSSEMWQQASNYSSEDKVKFLKMVCADKEKDKSQNVSENPNHKEQTEVKSDLLIEPLASVDVVEPTKTLVQDPFELVCQAKLSSDLEQVHLNMQPGSILQPQKSNSNGLTDQQENNSNTCTVNLEKGGGQNKKSAVRPLVVKGTSQEGHQDVPGRPSVEVSLKPVGLPQALQIMDGAQSGANAVAIEIPEGYHHGAAHKEEDVTASGGAACTSASAETGEIMSGNRSSQEAAAVSHKIKTSSCVDRTEALMTVGTPVPFAHQSSSAKKSRKSETAKHSEDVISTTKGKKEVAPKAVLSSSSKRKSTPSMEKRSSKGRDEGMMNAAPTADLGSEKVEADVESGEKVLKERETTTLQYKDFTRYMKKVKKDLHSSIVKDVTKVTGKLITQQLSRSNSTDSSSVTGCGTEVVHRGIYCDSCNSRIKGIRFKCGNCPDFDLCERCETSSNLHDPTHVFLKLPNPVSHAGRVGKEKFPLLREIIYKKDGRDSGGSIASRDKVDRSQSQGGVPILSASDISSPVARLQAGPASAKSDVNKWVWDSTFDTDHKNLYSMEEESNSNGPSSCKTDNPYTFSNSDIQRLYGLLSLEAEAEKRVEENVAADGINEECCHVDTDNKLEEVNRIEHGSRVEDRESLSSIEFVEVVDGEESYEELASNDGQESFVDTRQEEEVADLQDHFDQPEACDSDTSDDFCILDPPSRDSSSPLLVESPFLASIDSGASTIQITEAMSSLTLAAASTPGTGNAAAKEETTVGTPPNSEADQMEAESVVAVEIIDAIPLQPATLIVGMEKEGPVALEARYQAEGVQTDGDGRDDKEEEKKDTAVSDEEEDKECEVVVEATTEEEETKPEEEDVLINMSAEERRLFLEMVSSLKDRAEDLERELKVRKNEEARETNNRQEEEVSYQAILAEKQKEAVRENEKLEELRRKEHEEKRRVQLEKERKSRQEKNKGKSTRTAATPTLMQMALNARDKEGASPVKADGSDLAPSAPPMTQQQQQQQQQTVASTKDRRDADCQTGPSGGGAEAAAQASQMLQNVASGVSKAAEVAFHTAKDVFYSLQAKPQVEKKSVPGVVYSRGPTCETTEWKPQENTWVPPVAHWSPPADTFVPLKSTWTPPKSGWTPPKSEWTGPKTEWTPPPGFYMEPSLEGQTSSEDKSADTAQGQGFGSKCTEATDRQETRSKSCDQTEVSASAVDQEATSSPVSDRTGHPFFPPSVVDSTPRRETGGMQTLIEMGFANRALNRKLLQRYSGNVQKVVQALLQEERGGHWSSQRH